MHSVPFVPPELCHLHRYICYEERVCTLCHLYLQSYVICTDTSVIPNVYALCGICTSRVISSAQIIGYAERVSCTLCHLYLQSYNICTDTSVMKNVYALCGICTSRAMSYTQIHLLWRTCMHSVASVPPELYHLPRYFCYEERMPSLPSYSCDICTEHMHSNDTEFMCYAASVPSQLCHMYSTEYISVMLNVCYMFTLRSVPWRIHLLFRKWRRFSGAVPSVLVLLLIKQSMEPFYFYKPVYTLTKKKIKFSSNIRKFRMEQLQSLYD